MCLCIKSGRANVVSNFIFKCLRHFLKEKNEVTRKMSYRLSCSKVSTFPLHTLFPNSLHIPNGFLRQPKKNCKQLSFSDLDATFFYFTAKKKEEITAESVNITAPSALALMRIWVNSYNHTSSTKRSKVKLVKRSKTASVHETKS